MLEIRNLNHGFGDKILYRNVNLKINKGDKIGLVGENGAGKTTLVNILSGKMSFVGPRPALWNQYDLIEERDKYHANDIKPGLTGLAQVSGRDELEIPVKAKFDGEYVKKRNLFYDLGLIFKTAIKVFKHDGVVEGGTGEMKNQKEKVDVK